MLLGSSHNAGRASLAALGLLLTGTATGLLPVGKFFAPPTPPAPRPVTPHRPLVPVGPVASRGALRAGPLALEAVLGQSQLLRGGDGSLFLDLKLTAADVPASAGERRPVDLALVLDVSGSMADDNKITLLRQACLGLASKPGPDDRVAVVSFSDDARLLFPLQGLGDAARPAYEQAIRRLVPCGSTNLSGGLEAGAAELRRAGRTGAARRLLLLTDGIANRGITDPNGLGNLAARLGTEGFSVSTVGLGLDYNAGLLSSLGDKGGGHYFYVDAAEKIAAVYASELEGLRALAAKNVRLALQPAPGVRIVQVVSWPCDAGPDGKTQVTIGDVEAGRASKIVVQLEVPTSSGCMTAEGTSVAYASIADVVAVGLQGEEARTGETLRPAPLALAVGITEDRAAADASVALDVQKDLVNARVAAELSQARHAAEQGRLDEAKRSFDRIRRMNVDHVEYRAADGRVEQARLGEIEKGLCAPAAAGTNAAMKADKDVTSAIRAAGR